ncbi:MAG: hypothetical protein MZV64_35820 [Ignavibacteriales bacterium]|nr:hypothetical protein [Ignavibacteriales bacterium]
MELVNDFVAAGSYSVDFNGSDLASGMYIYRMAGRRFCSNSEDDVVEIVPNDPSG